MFKEALAKYGLLVLGLIFTIGSAIVHDKVQNIKINEAIKEMNDASKN